MYNVAQVLSSGFGRSWHECVAIVQEAASLMQPGLALPGPEDLVLDEDGTLGFGFGSEGSEHPVAGLAILLQALLEGVEAPAGLLDLAAENATQAPAHATVASFTRALAFYERPNRSNDLRAVAGRLRGPRDTAGVDVDKEFARLREKVAGSPEAEDPEKKAEQKAKARRMRLSRRQRQVIAGGIAAGLVIGFTTVQLRNNPEFSVRSAFASIDGGMSDAVAAGLNRLGVSIPASAAPASKEPLEKPSAREETRPAARPRTQSAAGSTRPSGGRQDARSLVAPAPAPARPSSAPGARGVPLVARLPGPPAMPDSFEPSAFEPSATVYSPEDTAVAPPLLTRPQMPKEPKPGDDTGYFDLLVDETGSVEQVKLISPTRGYHDRMLVAAAKAWQFKPATLDGHPVKYRVLIPIILPGMP